MTAPELKPCPFCGGEAEIWRAHEGRTAWIACMGKCVVLISKEYLSDDEAIAAWNRRADIAAVQLAQEVHEEQNTEQSKRFWNWLPLAYRDGHIGEQAKFTKYNMEVAHYAGWCHALEPQPDPRDEVLNQAMKDAITMGEGWIRTLQDGTLQLIDPTAVRLMPDATDPRDEVIARLVEATEQFLIEYDEVDLAVHEPKSLTDAVYEARAAIAAAKAVQHG